LCPLKNKAVLLRAYAKSPSAEALLLAQNAPQTIWRQGSAWIQEKGGENRQRGI